MLVGSKAAAHARVDCVPHVWSRPLPVGSIVQLTPEVGCVSPLLLPLQLAEHLTELELIMLLSEMMGLYALPEGELTQRTRPLVTREDYVSYLDEIQRARNIALVRNALAKAPELAASPMEAALYVRATFGFSKGGYGFSGVTLNDPFELRRIDEFAPTPHFRKTDLLFTGPKGSVALEYNGRQHGSTVRRDMVRRNELLAAGFTPFEIWKEQYDDLGYMDGLMAAVRTKIGSPPRNLSRERAMKERRGRQRLWQDLGHALRRVWERSEKVR